MKTVLITLAFTMSGLLAFAQKDKTEKTVLTDNQSKEILKSLAIDTTKFLRDFSMNACKCIDSISLANKNSNQLSQEISECIDKQVSVYNVRFTRFCTKRQNRKNSFN